MQQKQALQQKIADLNEAMEYLTHKMENNGKHLAQFEKTLDPDESSDLG